MTPEKQLDLRLRQMNIALNEKQLKQFVTYYNMVVEKNKVMNLTAITAYEDFIDKHFADSLAITGFIDFSKISAMMDVGTGAGFPGIPLKIVDQDLKVTLLDSLNKRIRFLGEVSEALELQDVTMIHGRAEDFAHQSAYREKYDLCVSRAVANLSTLSEYCLPFVKVGGMFAAYKSGDYSEELEKAKKAISLLGGEIADIHSFSLPGTEIERSIIIIRKRKETGKKYPRKAGMPSKEPL